LLVVLLVTIGNDMTQQWIGPDESLSLGDVGFLIQFSNENNGGSNWVLRDTPAYTNVSNVAELHGWCGSWNNVSTHAHGMAKVIRVAKNGRCLVEALDGEELQLALEELGYPDLT
jgi:hypothetical protein